MTRRGEPDAPAGPVVPGDSAFGPEVSAGRARRPAADLARALAFALEVCSEADAIALGAFRRDVEVMTKPDRTYVTAADQAIERLVRERIERTYAADGVVGEEYGDDRPLAAARWHIDPIDGTHNFIRGVPLFGTLLALEVDGELQVGVLSAPALGQRWYAARGAGAWSAGGVAATEPRRIAVSSVGALEDGQLLYGSIVEIEASGRAPGFRSLLGDMWRERGFGDFWGYALVAEGAAEAMVEVGVKTWDLAAPTILVEEAGGRVTDFGGRRRIDGFEIVASNGRLHEPLLDRLRG